MSHYGIFQYSEEKYGATVESSLSWGLLIDWNNDGVFDETNDGFYLNDIKTRRGRNYYVKPDGSGFERIKPGEFNGTLIDLNGRFDPYNTSSPLYPHVMPGSKFKLIVKDNSTGITYPVMTGRISDLRPSDALGYTKVSIKGVDNLAELSNSQPYIDAQEVVDIDDAVGQILSNINWEYGSVIQNTPEFIPYWWAGGRKTIDELNDLADATLGVGFVSNTGTFNFYSRYNSPTPRYTLLETTIELGIFLLQPWETIRNAIRVVANSLTRTSSIELWRLQTGLLLDANSSTILWINYSYSGKGVAGLNVITPVATTDYTANSNADGSGTDLIAQITVSLSSYGESGKLTITNNASVPAHITLLKVRGDALSLDNKIVSEKLHQGSIDIYQRREFVLDDKWLQNIAYTSSHADHLKTKLSTPIFFPSVVLRNEPDKQFTVDLFDRVGLYFPSKGISGSYYVSSIEHEWTTENGWVVDTRLRFEPAPDLPTIWKFTTRIGVSSNLGF